MKKHSFFIQFTILKLFINKTIIYFHFWKNEVVKWPRKEINLRCRTDIVVRNYWIGIVLLAVLACYEKPVPYLPMESNGDSQSTFLWTILHKLTWNLVCRLVLGGSFESMLSPVMEPVLSVKTLLYIKNIMILWSYWPENRHANWDVRSFSYCFV